MQNSNYVVQYGVNNSHMDTFEMFELYRDANKFYDDLAAEQQSKTIYKAFYKGEKNHALISNIEYKRFKFESGLDNTKLLLKIKNDERL